MMHKTFLMLTAFLFISLPVFSQSTAPLQDANVKYVDGAEVTSYTQYGIPFWSLTAILNNLAPPTDARPHLIMQAGTGSAAQAPTEPALGQPIDACNTGATYTVLTTDDGRVKCQSGTTASTWSIGTASGGTGFDQNWFTVIANDNSSGAVTVSATISTFRSSGSTSLVIEPGVACAIIGDNTNWNDYCYAVIASGVAATCTTCVTSAAALTVNQPVVGGGSQASATLATSFTSLTTTCTGAQTWAIASAWVANASITITGSCTLNLTNPLAGGNYVLVVTQGSGGSHTLALGTGCTWKVSGGGSGGITPTTTAAAIDVLAFTYDGTNCYANYNKNFN